MYAQYFLTLVKEASGEFTLVVVPRTTGVSTRHMEMSGSTTAGTAFVEFDDVEVPLDMVVGERGKGFKYIVSNFNHEVRSPVGNGAGLICRLKLTSGLLSGSRGSSSQCSRCGVPESA